jgi:AcrR family transcriptional regulator
VGEQRPEARIRDLGQAHGAVVTAARERLLSEAFVLFYMTGIRAVGVDLIIARSGVAKATFYRHFPSKAELVFAYVRRRHDAWLAWLAEEVTARATTGAAHLLAIFDALGGLFADPDYRGCAVLNAVAEVGDSTPQILEQARAHKAELRDYVAALAAEARLSRPGQLAEEVVLLIDGAMVRAQRDPGSGVALAARRACEKLLAANGDGGVRKRAPARRS